ncbi:class I SAM-dependent methyltransferase [Nonomuraea sp. NPDC049028]|uniref:class I SAM-dependent methyltransferase n=1 Tax=Nonomuraea sp. NPDC049028 TaxID=3364348 RepID=UPI00371E7566
MANQDIKRAQARDWDAAGQGLAAFADELEVALGVVTKHLTEMAEIRLAQTVLDLGTGYGEPALSLARAVGPDGAVTGIDLSPRMIELARRRGAGMPNVEFLVGDFDALPRPDASADAVIARFALMFTPDRLRTFREILRVLVPGGTLAASVWAVPQLNRFALGTLAIARAVEAPPPPPGAPSPFAMADARALAEHLEGAGFEGVRIEEVVVPFQFASTRRYAELSLVVTPPGLLEAARRRLGSGEAIAAAVMAAAEPFAGPDGSVLLPSTAWCVRAVKPA